MHVSKSTFDSFCGANAAEHPFNSIRITRNAFHCKWLVSKSRGDTSIFRVNRYHLIPTSALSLDTVNSIVVNGNAFPIPTDLNDAIDTMEWWGRRVSPMWEQTLLNLLMEDYFKDKNTPVVRHQCFSFVAILLQERIREQNVATEDFDNVMFHCVDWFDLNWNSNMHFYELVIKTLRWLHLHSPLSDRFTVTPQHVPVHVVTPTRVPSYISSAED